MAPRDYWLTCLECKYEWIGMPYKSQDGEESCPECGAENFEVGQEHKTFDWPSPFWILLLIPNLLLFGGAL